MAIDIGRQALTATAPATAGRDWLFGPCLDSLLVANVAWPLLLLWQWNEGFAGQVGLQFWQVYFVTTPHRWVTIAIVFLDRERFQQRKRTFLAIAAGVATVCLGIRLAAGTLVCLLAVDYAWNAWHFAAQHHGIYRIYGRANGAASRGAMLLEKWLMRSFLLFVFLRVAIAAGANFEWQRRLEACDAAAVAIAAGLFANHLIRRSRGRWGATIYLASVFALYLSLLWAVRADRPELTISLTTASALFHATEYLAVVSWSVRRRDESSPRRQGALGYLAQQWGCSLGAFMVILGAGGWLMERRLMDAWLLVNVIAAFLHYAYDGLIWRHRPSPQIFKAQLTTAGIGR